MNYLLLEFSVPISSDDSHHAFCVIPAQPPGVHLWEDSGCFCLFPPLAVACSLVWGWVTCSSILGTTGYPCSGEDGERGQWGLVPGAHLLAQCCLAWDSAGNGCVQGPGSHAAHIGRILAKCQLRYLTQIWVKALFLFQVELIIYIYS